MVNFKKTILKWKNLKNFYLKKKKKIKIKIKYYRFFII